MSDLNNNTEATGTIEVADLLEEMDIQETENPIDSSTDQQEGSGNESEPSFDDETQSKTKDPEKPVESGVPIIVQCQDEVELPPIDSSGTKGAAAICSPESPQMDPSSPGCPDLNALEAVRLVGEMRSRSHSKAPTEEARETRTPEENVASQQTSLMAASTAGQSNAASASDLPTGVAQTMHSEKDAAEKVAATTEELRKPEPQPVKSSPPTNIGGKCKDLITSPKEVSGTATSSIETTSKPMSLEDSGSKSSIEKNRESISALLSSISSGEFVPKQFVLLAPLNIQPTSGEFEESMSASSSSVQGDTATAQSSLPSPERSLVDISSITEISRLAHTSPKKVSGTATSSIETTSRPMSLEDSGSKSSIEKTRQFSSALLSAISSGEFVPKQFVLLAPLNIQPTSGEFEESMSASSSSVQGDTATAQSSLPSPERSLVDISSIMEVSRLAHQKHFETSDPSTPEPSEGTSLVHKGQLHQQQGQPLPRQQEQREERVECPNQEPRRQPLDLPKDPELKEP